MSMTPMAPPPHYEPSGSTSAHPSILVDATDNFFDIVPQSDATSFQVGYLGLDGFQAWIKGDVLIKLDERTRQQRHLYEQCSIALIAEEKDSDQSIQIFTATQVLWQRGGDASSSSSSLAKEAAEDFAPSTMPFSFQLTSDLPHCIHLPHSSLGYRLVATLKSSNEGAIPSTTREVIVHLTRYTRPGQLNSHLCSPHIWQIDTPTPMTITLRRSLYRRAEPISVHLNIPPPDQKQLTLNLRSVEANLYRIIQGRQEVDKHELLLAHSGKLCRFHSTRSIVLHLTLHPPFDSSNMPYPHPDHDAALSGPVYGRGGGGGCESISQETLLHKVSFLIKILVGIRGENGERRDVVLQREVQILPGAAGGIDAEEPGTSSKKAEVEEASQEAGPSNASPLKIAEEGDQYEEEEYDGYEDVGRSLSSDGSDDDIADVVATLSAQDDDAPPTLLQSRNDLQVEVEVEGVGAGVPRSPPIEEQGYTWRRDDDLPVLDTRPHEDDEQMQIPHISIPRGEENNLPQVSRHAEEELGAHRPPPYMPAQSIRIPRIRMSSREDTRPPAYVNPSILPPFVATQHHPPSYEA